MLLLNPSADESWTDKFEKEREAVEKEFEGKLQKVQMDHQLEIDVLYIVLYCMLEWLDSMLLYSVYCTQVGNIISICFK